MNDYQTSDYTPPRRTAPAVIVSAICLAVAAAGLLLGATGVGWRAPLQLMALIGFVAAIELTTRYILTVYTYHIVYKSDGIDFRVSKPNGKGIKTVCSIALQTVRVLTPYKDLSELQKKHGSVSHVFNYTANMFPIKKGQLKDDPDCETLRYAMLFEFNGTANVVILECTEQYALWLSSVIDGDTGTEADMDEAALSFAPEAE